MIDFVPIDELHDARRRLATEAGLDVERSAKMLAETANMTPGTYAAKPLGSASDHQPPAKAS